MMKIALHINADLIEELLVINRGTTNPTEAADPAGERLYTVTVISRQQVVEVRHRRGDGAFALAAKALAAADNQQHASDAAAQGASG